MTILTSIILSLGILEQKLLELKNKIKTSASACCIKLHGMEERNEVQLETFIKESFPEISVVIPSFGNEPVELSKSHSRQVIVELLGTNHNNPLLQEYNI